MQRRKPAQWLFVSFLTMLFLLFYAGVTPGGQTLGIIDYADEKGIRGWAMNSSDLSVPAQVRVVITRQANGTVAEEFSVTASGVREDLKGQGSANCGFEISVPWNSYGEGIYLVDAYVGGQKLSGSKAYGVGAQAAANLQGDVSSIRSLGKFKTTAYCPCRKCSGRWGGRTSTGNTAKANHTIAVDPRVIPYGSRLLINGVIYTAEDCGGGVNGNHIDIFFNTHGETYSYGIRSMEVFLVQ